MLPIGVIALGLVQGSLAALNAMGIVLVWRATRVINLAQPALGLVGGVLTGLLVVSAGWSFWWAAPIGLVAGALLGLLADRLVMARLQDAPRAVLLVVTVGLAQLFGGLQTALPFVFGGILPSYQVELGISVDLFPVRLSGSHLLALALVPLLWLPLRWFLHHSRYGLAALGLGQDAERARALGVQAGLVRSVIWAIAGTLSAASGILAVPVLGFNLGGAPGPGVLLLALAPAVVVGLRSLGGAAFAALALGVIYQAALWWSPRAGIADLALAGVVLVAVLVQRRKWGRSESAASASSWAAAATPRPLPTVVTAATRFRVAAGLTTAVAVFLVALPPWFLGPSDTLLYATTAALVMTTIGVAAAWMFGGEVALGHWGFAGFGAAITLLFPGPWLLRAVAATILVGALGAALAVATRAHPGRSFAVLGLAVAVSAPVMVAMGGSRPPLDPTMAGSLTAAVAVLIAVGVIKLRSSTVGVRLVTARDEPHRAAWLGADPRRSRVIALTISAMIAGIAGSLYIAVLPSGAAPGAFDPQRSLDLLATAVVGGLGSPIGVLLGAAGLLAGQLYLPGSWALLTSGVGVILVVMFLPAGLGHVVELVRDRVVRTIVGHELFPVAQRTSKAAANDTPLPPLLEFDERTHIAGSDTREVVATSTVRAAALATFFLAGPAWAAALGAPTAWAAVFAWDGEAPVWIAVGLVVGAVLLLTAARQRPTRPRIADDAVMADATPVHAGVAAAAAVALLTVAVSLLGWDRFAVVAMLVVVAAGAWAIGRAARLSMEASTDKVQAAALGVIGAAAFTGLIPAAHLAMVLSGSDYQRAALWAAAYAVLGGVYLVRAGRFLPHDRRRVGARVVAPAATEAQEQRTNATPAPLLIRDAHVRFGGAEILTGANLQVERGEVVALVGGNGAGKSTLLRIAAGFVRPDAGRVLVAGEDMTTLRPEERANAGLAFISGARPVFPDLNVLENLRVASYATHKTQKSHQEATETILELVPGLRDRRNQRAGLLSGGEQRLLAVAQMLYRRPTVLLADELSLGLDTAARHGVLDLLRRLADEGVAVVAVDHDLPSLLARSDRAVLLSGGVGHIYDRPTDILEQRADLLPATFLTGSAL